jgi:hypothetical protein
MIFLAGGFMFATKQVDIDDIIRYEQGDMDSTEAIDFFQRLIDTGLAWELQGHYGRTAQSLINGGYCHETEKNSKASHRQTKLSGTN